MKWFLMLLSILKFIGIAVLVLLALAVVLLLVILFSGIRYEARANDADNRAEGFVSYIFGLVRFSFCYVDKSFEYGLRVAFFKISDSKKKSDKDKKKSSEKTKLKHKASDTTREKSNIKTVKEKRKATKPSSKKVKKNKTDKKRKSLDTVIDILKKYDIKQLIKVSIKFLKAFFKALGIKKLEADAVFGFDDPSTTGLVLGGASALVAFLPFRIGLRGNFEGKAFEFKGNLKGKTSLIKLIVPVVKLVMEKPVWEIITNKRG